MMLPCRGLVARHADDDAASPSRRASRLMRLEQLGAAERLVGDDEDRLHARSPPTPSVVAGVAVDPAGAGTSAPLKTPCTAPGTPYSYGPPTTVGIASKLKIGGGEETCHSSVSARHGLATARGPPRHEATML